MFADPSSKLDLPPRDGEESQGNSLRSKRTAGNLWPLHFIGHIHASGLPVSVLQSVCQGTRTAAGALSYWTHFTMIIGRAGRKRFGRSAPWHPTLGPPSNTHTNLRQLSFLGGLAALSAHLPVSSKSQVFIYLLLYGLVLYCRTRHRSFVGQGGIRINFPDNVNWLQAMRHRARRLHQPRRGRTLRLPSQRPSVNCPNERDPRYLRKTTGRASRFHLRPQSSRPILS